MKGRKRAARLDALVRDYRRGLSVKEVAALHHMPSATVYMHLRRKGVIRTRSKAAQLAYYKRGTTAQNLARENEPQLRRYSEGGISIGTLAKTTGHDYRTVRRALLLLGMRIRPAGGGRRYYGKTKNRVLALHRAGYGARAIAKRLKIPRPTVMNWVRRARRKASR